MNRKTNGYLIIATFITFIYFGVGHFVEFPEPVRGLMLGLSMSFYILGVFLLKYDISKVKSMKRNLIRKLIK